MAAVLLLLLEGRCRPETAAVIAVGDALRSVPLALPTFLLGGRSGADDLVGKKSDAGVTDEMTKWW